MSDFEKVGKRAQVFHGNAFKTTGGLRKKDLYKNKRGRIVSMKKSRTAKNWNPLKMLGLLSKSGEPFGARTFRKGSVSRTRRGANGQIVLDFFTHKGSRVKRHGKKYKAYYSRKGSVRKTNKWTLGRDYSQSGGMQSLNPSSYPENPPKFEMPIYTPEERALMAVGGRRTRGGNSLTMTNLDSAYPSQLSNADMGQNTPLNRALNAGI
jgi:hypothetical protein